MIYRTGSAGLYPDGSNEIMNDSEVVSGYEDIGYGDTGYEDTGYGDIGYEEHGYEEPDFANIREDDDTPDTRAAFKRFKAVAASIFKWVSIYMGRFAAAVVKTSIVVLLTLAFGVIGAGVGAVYAYLQDVEPLDNISLNMKIQTSYIYDANGTQIASLTGSSNINRQLVRWEDISPHLSKALIAIEDKRFDSHNGVDLRRIVGAGLQFVLGGSDSHGASTITQQLVKNVTGKKNETLERKVQEWYLAIELEKTMEKWKILELYLNVVYFGNGSYGVSSAARTYFGKTAKELSVAESAFIIGITNSPGLYNPYTEKGLANAYKRQRIILGEMYKQGSIASEANNWVLKQDLLCRRLM
jgi:penicillin-binding protein 1A